MKRKNGSPPDKEAIVKAVEERKAEIQKKLAKGNGKFEVDSKFIADCLYTHELGSGILYAALLADKYIYNSKSKEWFIWTGYYWERDVLSAALADIEKVNERLLKEAKELVEKIDWADRKKDKDQVKTLKKRQNSIYTRVRNLRSVDGRGKCLTMARSNKIKSLSITGEDFDHDPYLFACANGVIDLKMGEINPGRQQDYISKFSPVEWKGIDEPAPNWEKNLLEIFLNDSILIDYIQRLIGYAMLGVTIEHVLPVLWGEAGRNGKGTMVEMIQYVMGTYAGPIQAEMLLDQGRGKSSAGPSPDIMSLKGLRIAFASETDQNRYFSTSKVKWLSGGDTLVGRAPHDKYETRFRPSHTLFLMTNNKPHAPAEDAAFWERVHLVPFRVSFVRREPQGDFERPADIYMGDKLRDEAPGILAWMVRGCLQWQAIGLDPPELVTDATREYRRDEDLLADFIDECCFIEADAECGATEIYTLFQDWWQRTVSKKIPAQKKFGRWMGRKFKKEKVGTYKYFGVGILEPGTFDSV